MKTSSKSVLDAKLKQTKLVFNNMSMAGKKRQQPESPGEDDIISDE